jgi:hypothetical protein
MVDVPAPVAPAKTPVPPTTVNVEVTNAGLPNDLSAPGADVDLPGVQTVPVSRTVSVLPSASVITLTAVAVAQPVSGSNPENSTTLNVDVASPKPATVPVPQTNAPWHGWAADFPKNSWKVASSGTV